MAYLPRLMQGHLNTFIEMVYSTHVFFGLLAHEFSVRWMKNRCLAASICFVTLICWAHFERYCLKSKVALLLSHFPIVPARGEKGFVPATGDCLDVAAVLPATSPLRPSPSLRVGSLSRIVQSRLPLLELWRYVISPLCSL